MYNAIGRGGQGLDMHGSVTYTVGKQLVQKFESSRY